MNQSNGGVRIASLQVENVKRVKAIHLVPSPAGLTVIGGKNGQGKTSVLDAIAWALGGGKREPSNAKREGSMANPEISLVLSNGLRVERKGKNGTLSVIDPSGARAGQQLLDAFVSQFALDLPKFLNASNKEKAQILLQTLGIGDQLAALDADEKRLYSERHTVGQIADSKTKYAEELPEYADAPDEPVSVSELIQQQQAILAKNGQNQRKRTEFDQLSSKLTSAQTRVATLSEQLAEANQKLKAIESDYLIAGQSIKDLNDESTAQLEASLANIESINTQVAANAQKAAAIDEAAQYRAQYEAKTVEIESVRMARLALLDGSNIPLPGLSVIESELVFNGQRWDCMSGAERLRVAVAIVRSLNPDCRFVLMDRLEQMDLDTLSEFDAWLQGEGLQVIATRVSTGDECAIVIEDGLPVGMSYADVTTGVNAIAQDRGAPLGEF